MLLVYYHLYITYTLAGSLFDLESNACTKTYKKLNIEYGKTMITNFPEDIQHYKKIENTTEEVEQYFPSFLAFIEIQNSSEFQGPRIKKERMNIILEKRKDILLSRTNLWLTIIVGLSFIKQPRRKEQDM
jgi:hypothetical protein